jgi:hypothetical protein
MTAIPNCRSFSSGTPQSEIVAKFSIGEVKIGCTIVARNQNWTA